MAENTPVQENIQKFIGDLLAPNSKELRMRVNAEDPLLKKDLGMDGADYNNFWRDFYGMKGNFGPWKGPQQDSHDVGCCCCCT